LNKSVAFVLGIRPDLIRASIILESLRRAPDIDFHFIWSGQHYSDNMKDVFIRELGVQPPSIDLGCAGSTDAEVVGSLIPHLHAALDKLKPAATVFLGDTNTTLGAIASAQLNIPIVHIEGCMRSYDWRMPEEKYRATVDHLSDVIYTYFDEYKEQGIREGLNPDSIVVVGNLIVDVLERFYFRRRELFERMASPEFFDHRGLRPKNYYVMTCHRRENLYTSGTLAAILDLVESAPYPVYFLASYRTQTLLKDLRPSGLRNVKVVDPTGYEELLCLLVNSRGVFTDSGTLVEEACVLQVPSVQMRRSTERPQVYDARASVKFDPMRPQRYPHEDVYGKLEGLLGKIWDHGLGDGRGSERVARDLLERLNTGGFERHRPECYHLPIARSYSEDGL
jgi:UDP-N-acetylglucosamine 2-epimerase